MDLAGIRREYLKGGLSREDLAANPVEQLDSWLQQAINMELADPTAMVLATVDTAGQASQRIVLLKGLDQQGLVFFTNYESDKARDMARNARVSLHFPWYAIERQVSVCGVVEKVSEEESRTYFNSRPRESQIAAWTSAQSRKLASREELMERYRKILDKFADQEIPLPGFWGGFRVRPSSFEFWQGGAHRLHDRFRYQLGENREWEISRLSP